MSSRSVSFSVNLETVIHIERLHASLIQCLHYQQEDYKHFRTDKLLQDIREAMQEDREKLFAEQKGTFEKQRGGLSMDSLETIVPRQHFGTQKGGAQAA
jgi:hypothetical protein